MLNFSNTQYEALGFAFFLHPISSILWDVMCSTSALTALCLRIVLGIFFYRNMCFIQLCLKHFRYIIRAVFPRKLVVFVIFPWTNFFLLRLKKNQCVRLYRALCGFVLLTVLKYLSFTDVKYYQKNFCVIYHLQWKKILTFHISRKAPGLISQHENFKWGYMSIRHIGRVVPGR